MEFNSLFDSINFVTLRTSSKFERENQKKAENFKEYQLNHKLTQT